MMRYNHTKPAPCISHNGLLYLRATLSISMVISTIYILIETGAHSLAYLSQWSLLLTTVTFALLFRSQIKSARMVKKDGITLVDDEDDETAAVSDPNSITLMKPY